MAKKISENEQENKKAKKERKMLKEDIEKKEMYINRIEKENIELSETVTHLNSHVKHLTKTIDQLEKWNKPLQNSDEPKEDIPRGGSIHKGRQQMNDQESRWGEKKRTICKYNERGTCRFGEECRFIHRRRQEYRYFREYGWCKYRENCRFIHGSTKGFFDRQPNNIDRPNTFNSTEKGTGGARLRTDRDTTAKLTTIYNDKGRTGGLGQNKYNNETESYDNDRPNNCTGQTGPDTNTKTKTDKVQQLEQKVDRLCETVEKIIQSSFLPFLGPKTPMSMTKERTWEKQQGKGQDNSIKNRTEVNKQHPRFDQQPVYNNKSSNLF